jgi:hypothetical protein
MSTSSHVTLGGLTCQIEVIRRREESPDVPRLLTVCYNSSAIGVAVTQVAVRSIFRHTPQPFVLWVVDNASPPEQVEWLRALEGVNVILNHTPPVPPSRRGWRARMGLRRVQADEQMKVGSYANAIGLELGARAIDPATLQLFVMHNDVLALRDNWLPYLQSKLAGPVRAAAVLRDTARRRIGALHISGLLFDFTLFHRLGISFFPDLPQLDVGDGVTAALREQGYQEFACRNTHTEPDLVAWIPADDPLHHLHADRAFDDERRVIFAHLGRGTPKSLGLYDKPGRTYPEQWVAYAEEHVLA